MKKMHLNKFELLQKNPMCPSIEIIVFQYQLHSTENRALFAEGNRTGTKGCSIRVARCIGLCVQYTGDFIYGNHNCVI